MFLDNSLQDSRGAGVIPDGLRVNDRDWALLADSQAIGFRAIDQRLRPNQVQLFEPALQILPGFQALDLGRAFGFRLISAEENMAAIFLQAEGIDRGFQTGNAVLRR